MKEREATIQDVLQAINIFSSDVTEEFRTVNERLTNVESRLTKVESTMVTKDYLDRKLFEYKGEIMERADREFVHKSRTAIT